MLTQYLPTVQVTASGSALLGAATLDGTSPASCHDPRYYLIQW